MQLRIGIVNSFYKNYIINALLALFGLIVCLLSPLNPFSSLSPGIDSSVFLYIGKSMAKFGEVPYRDIFDHKGPLLYLINYLGIKLNGYLGIWLVEVVFMQLNVFLIFTIAKIITKDKLLSFFTTILVMLPLAVYFEGGNFVEEYALPFILVSLYLFIAYLKSDSKEIPKLRIFIIGLTCGSVLLLRPNMIAIWVSFCFIICLHLICIKKYDKLLLSIILFILGNAAIIAPFAGYFIYQSALADFLNSYWFFNLDYTSSAGGLTSLIKTFLGFWDTTVLIGISLLICIIGIIISYGPEDNCVHKADFTIFLSSGLYLMASMFLLSISGNIFGHYGMTLIPCLIIPIAKLLEWINKGLSIKLDSYQKKVYLRVIINILIVMLLSLTLAARWVYKIADVNLSSLDTETNQIVTHIQEHTQADDKIIVIGNKCSIYLLSERKASSKYIYQAPVAGVSEEVLEEFIDEIELSKPKLMIYEVPSNISLAPYQETIRIYLSNLVDQGVYKLNDKITDRIWVYEKIDQGDTK